MTAKRTAVVKTVIPVQTGEESGHLVYLGSRLLGFIRSDVARQPMGEMIGPHHLLQPIRVPVSEFRRFCRMPGYGYVDR